MMAVERELWFMGQRQVEVRQADPLSVLAPGEVRVRALHSGISQGTELLLYRGEGPRVFDPSLDAAGAPMYPRRYGYSWVGEIVESCAQGAAVGERIFALRPHGDVHVLRAEHMRKIPEGIPSARATLAANLETALTVVWDAGISIGDRVVVVGGGVVGLLSAMLAKAAGSGWVRVIEPSPRRRRAALDLGVDEALAPEQDKPRGDCDAVIEASGDPACLDRAIAHAGQEATIVVASFYGERRSPISLGTEFHRRRLQLKASQVSRLPPQKTARWDSDRRFATVIGLLANPRLDTLIDPPVPFAEAAAWYARLDADPGIALHSVFAYGREEFTLQAEKT
jgi:2-desacetyl-2-hydroxyethyl bacteriochlorophyllide A dehydrogenase